MTDDGKDGEPNRRGALPASDLSAGELGLVSGLWLAFGTLSYVSGQGLFSASLHTVAAALTLGCAWLAHRGRTRAALHGAAAVAALGTTTYCLAAGAVNDGVLVLVVLPVLATYLDSPRAGLVWLGLAAVELCVLRVVDELGVVPRLIPPLTTAREPVVLALAAVLWVLARRSRSRSDEALEQLAEREREARARADDLARLKQTLEDKNAALDALNERFAASAREVSEMNVALGEAKDAAERRAREAVDFLNRMSHEIRTPLNGILGITDVLLGGKLERETREHVAILESSGKLLRRLVDEVLDLARLDAGKLQLVEEPFDPLTVAEDVADLFAAQAFSKGLILVTMPSEEPLPKLLGDVMRVRQVLQNLVGNAVKFTARGHVRIDVALDGGTLRYQVLDTGPGMSEEALAGLFREYEQGREGARRGGSGLGLVIARRLAQAMGGDVEARSEPGRGSEFVARFAVTRSSTQTADVGELSGAVAQVGLVGGDPLTAEALTRVAALVNVHVRRFDGITEGLAARPRVTAIFTASDVPPRSHDGPPVIRLRAPTSTDGGLGSTPALLLPPRRARLVRILRRSRGPTRETTREMAAVIPTGLRALVVDDEPVNRKVASLLLVRCGWIAMTASSGEEALASVRSSERIDAVLVDLDMPGLDGIETVRALASGAQTGRRPWLVLQTASIEDSARARALDAGAMDFLPKPVDGERLREVLQRAARHRRAEDLRLVRGLRPPPREGAALSLLGLLTTLTVAVIAGESEVAMAALGELQLDARRRQLERIDRACTALHDALLEGDGIEAMVELEDAVSSFARDASITRAAGI
ncbi:MAG: hypothetical protein OHK0013_03240 [Sandaracinaceae bacterium]